MYGGGLGIYRDLHEPNPARRYKIAGGSPAGCYSDAGNSNCVVGTAASPDGISKWTDVEALGFPAPWRPDCHTNLFYDELKEVYRLTSRDYVKPSGRDIAISTSGKGSPAKHWTGNWTLKHKNEFPPASPAGKVTMVKVDPKHAASACGKVCRKTDDCAFFWVYTAGKDAGKCFPKSAVESGPMVKPACTTCGGEWYKMNGSPVTPPPSPHSNSSVFGDWGNPVRVESGDNDHQLYSQITFPFYDIYLGIVMVFDATSKEGHVHCVLSWSADGEKWEWVDSGGVTGKEFIPAGPDGAFDSHVCFAAHMPIRDPVDGTSRIYFMGGNGPHSGLRNSSFGLVTAMPDRFAGVTTTATAGMLASNSTTRPITVTGKTMLLTVDVLAGGGSVVVGVVGEGSQYMAATALTATATDHTVVFPLSATGLADLVGKEVQLSFAVRNAVIYTVGFAK